VPIQCDKTGSKVSLGCWPISQSIGRELEHKTPACQAPDLAQITVEPPNKGHFMSRAFVLFSEFVLWWEVRANM